MLARVFAVVVLEDYQAFAAAVVLIASGVGFGTEWKQRKDDDPFNRKAAALGGLLNGAIAGLAIAALVVLVVVAADAVLT